MKSWISHFQRDQSDINDRYLKHFLWNCPQVNARRPLPWLVNIGSGNGLVPSGNKPLPEPILTRSMSPYSIARPQWVNSTVLSTDFYPSALRPEGYCRCLRPSVCLSVRLSVCLSVRPYDHACPRDNSKNIFQIFSKLAWNILWVNISDKFDDGYRSSLNMRIIDQKVTLTFFEFLK